MDRRQLLKAGAWAAPVIVLATASPAAAAVSQTEVLAFNNFFVGWTDGTIGGQGGHNGITANTSVRNTTGSGDVNGLSVVFTIDEPGLGTTAVIDATSTGWTVNAGTASGGKLSFTFTYGPTLGTFASTSVLIFTVAATAILTDAKAWTAIASAPGAASAPAQGTIQP